MAGKRKETVYAMPTPVSGDHYIGSNMSVPFEKEVGGVTVFMLDMEQIKRCNLNNFGEFINLN